MKRIFTLALIVLSFVSAVSGQEKKTVAVYVTGNCSENIRKIVGSRIIAHIVRSKDYAAVERTEDFNAALRREQNYQYSGNVDDGQVIKLGKQFGAGLVCVADASEKTKVSNYKYNYEYLFTARLINIETGLVMSFSLSATYCPSRSFCDKISNEKVVSETDYISAELLQNITTTAGKQKLAVYVTGSSGVFEGKTVSSRLMQNFTNSGAYAMVDRTSDFKAEFRVQQSGKVDDGQLSRLGRQFGVNLICVVDVISTNYTSVRMINVETGIIVATAESSDWEIEDVDAITKELLSQTDAVVVCSTKDKKITPLVGKCCTGLTLVDGVCRDVSSNVTYWIDKSRLGFEMMYEPVIAKAEDIVLNSDRVCPAGWRMPTKTEMERMIAIKEELGNFDTHTYVTSDFSISDYYDNHKNGTVFYNYWCWDNYKNNIMEFPLLTIEYKKGKEISRKYYSESLFVKCVRD
jgi:hypothetical protein